MGLTVYMNHNSYIEELIKKFPVFAPIKKIKMTKNEQNRWTMTCSEYKYVEENVFQMQVMFIGKSGYGKSTTLNSLIGKNAFETDDIEACTKQMYSANYQISEKEKTYLALCDLPGIGESTVADEEYLLWYRGMLEKSQCIVYILRADQRDFALDLALFKSMFSSGREKQKVFIGLNYADKIEPISNGKGLTEIQMKNLVKKVKEVASIFSLSESDVIWYSAKENINIDKLSVKIMEKLK